MVRVLGPHRVRDDAPPLVLVAFDAFDEPAFRSAVAAGADGIVVPAATVPTARGVIDDSAVVARDPDPTADGWLATGPDGRAVLHAGDQTLASCPAAGHGGRLVGTVVAAALAGVGVVVVDDAAAARSARRALAAVTRLRSARAPGAA